MLIIPREKPVVENLNSYYLDIYKLYEHYQGELGAGVVHFKSPTGEALVFFDEENLVNGVYEYRKERLEGPDAINRVNQMAPQNNFAVSVFRILPERIYFWANLSNSKVLYSDLSSEFTDLEALIKKMTAEKLTGYIDIRLNAGASGGLLFFYNGEVIGGSSEDGAGDIDRSSQYRDDLIQRTRQHGGTFNVRKIFLKQESASPIELQKVVKQQPRQARSAKPSGAPARPAPPKAQSPKVDTKQVVEMLQGLLQALENAVRRNKKIKADFETMLNKKFVEKADKYEFLDPFAAEFRYSSGQITYTGKAGSEELVASILECVLELTETLGITTYFRKQLGPWRSSFEDEIILFNIEL